jgi:hypothetical protein
MICVIKIMSSSSSSSLVESIQSWAAIPKKKMESMLKCALKCTNH